MRVLLTVHQYFPDHKTGTEVLTRQVASELAARGHEVRIITGYPLKSAPVEGRRFDQYQYQGLRVDRYFHQESAPVGAQRNIAELEFDNHLVEDWLRGLLSEWTPDVVHFFHLKNLSVSAIDVCHEHGLPMVLTPTDFWLVCPMAQLLLPNGSLCVGPDRRGVKCLRHAVDNTQPTYVRRTFSLMPDSLMAGAIRACSTVVTSDVAPFSWVRALSQRGDFIRQRVSLLDQMFVPTRFMGHLFEANGLTAKQVTHSRFGIDLDGFRRGAVRRGTEPRLRIGFIGSLARWKGAHVLVDAVRRLPPAIDVDVQIFGDPGVYPDYANGLVERAAGDARIRFCGSFPNSRIGEVLSTFDVFVVPSLWYENTPLVIYSSQAAGCPVLASDLGGMSEVIREGLDGLLFPPGDSTALAAHLERLWHDRDLVAVLADNAPSPKSIAVYVDELTIAYEELVDRHAVAGP